MRYENGEWKKRWYDRVHFARVAIILAVTAGISFGLCAVTVLENLGRTSKSAELWLNIMVPAELLLFGASIAGLVVLFVLYIVALLQKNSDEHPDQQR